MRGESKYHYVDLSLLDEHQTDIPEADPAPVTRDVSVSLERPNLKR